MTDSTRTICDCPEPAPAAPRAAAGKDKADFEVLASLVR